VRKGIDDTTISLTPEIFDELVSLGWTPPQSALSANAEPSEPSEPWVPCPKGDLCHCIGKTEVVARMRAECPNWLGRHKATAATVGEAGYPSPDAMLDIVDADAYENHRARTAALIRASIDWERERVAKLAGVNSTLQETVDAAVEVARRTGKFPGMQLPDNQFGAADWNPDRHKQPDKEAKLDSSQVIVDEFCGDTPNLIECIRALIELDEAGVLVPHGIGGHARCLLSSAAARLADKPPAAQGFGPVVRRYRSMESSRWHDYGPANLDTWQWFVDSPDYETQTLAVHQPVPADIIADAEWLVRWLPDESQQRTYALAIRDWLRKVSA
jgi:hypothetical protein